MRNFVHILILCLASLFVAGCDKSASDVPVPEKEVWVNLNIGVALSDAAKPVRSSRADGNEEAAANEAEKMQTLRIIVVDKNGDVEANRFLYAGSVVEYGEEHFKVRANETKQVYVFVNENNESVKVYDATGGLVADLHDYLGGIEVGEPFPRESIEGLEIRLNDGVDSELDAVGDVSAQSAGGLPMSGLMANEKCRDVLGPGMHATTFGANPVCAAAGLVVQDILSDTFLREVWEKGDYLRKGIESLNLPCFGKTRGMGLMIGVEVRDGWTNKDVANKLIENGLLILTAGPGMRLLPPLVISKDEMDKGLEIMKKTLG